MKRMICLLVTLLVIISSLSINCFASYFSSINYFAVINGEEIEEFNNFKDAYNAIDIYDMGDKGTIKLLRDAEIYEYCGINGVNLTLDLAGHKLSFYDEGEFCVLKGYWSGLNIISSEGVGVIENAYLTGGSLTVNNNVKIIDTYVDCHFNSVINGGYFESSKLVFDGDTEIFDGFFKENIFVLTSQSDLTVYGGTFYSQKDTFVYRYGFEKDKCKIAIKGGIFPCGISIENIEDSHTLLELLSNGYAFYDVDNAEIKLDKNQKGIQEKVSVKKARKELTVENKTYPTEFFYTGKSIENPSVDHFEFLLDNSEIMIPKSDLVKFSWHKNGEPIAKLPFEIGDYTLLLEVEEGNSYTSVCEEFDVAIKAPDFNCGTSFVTDNNDGAWCKSAYILNPNSGNYAVGFSESDFKSEEKVYVDFVIDSTLKYYVKEISTGYIKSITVNDSNIKVDPFSPYDLSAEVSSVTDVSAKVTLIANDIGSGINEYKLIPYKEGIIITDIGDGVFEVSGLTEQTEYKFKYSVSDNAGNVTESESELTFTTLQSEKVSFLERIFSFISRSLSNVRLFLHNIYMFIINLFECLR